MPHRWVGGGRSAARCLLASLRPGTLLLADRGYEGFEALRDAAATGADLLWRVQAGRLLPAIRPLPDGTRLTWITDRGSADRLAKWQQCGRRTAPPALTALTMRVISYQITVTRADGTSQASAVRLVTTLLDPQRYRAAELAARPTSPGEAPLHSRWHRKRRRGGQGQARCPLSQRHPRTGPRGACGHATSTVSRWVRTTLAGSVNSGPVPA